MARGCTVAYRLAANLEQRNVGFSEVIFSFLLESWHVNSAHYFLNRDGGGLLPHTCLLHLINKNER